MDQEEFKALVEAIKLELGKLNNDEDEEDKPRKREKDNDEVFRCPECNNIVKPYSKHCSKCGVELIWDD